MDASRGRPTWSQQHVRLYRRPRVTNVLSVKQTLNSNHWFQRRIKLFCFIKFNLFVQLFSPHVPSSLCFLSSSFLSFTTSSSPSVLSFLFPPVSLPHPFVLCPFSILPFPLLPPFFHIIFSSSNQTFSLLLLLLFSLCSSFSFLFFPFRLVICHSFYLFSPVSFSFPLSV